MVDHILVILKTRQRVPDVPECDLGLDKQLLRTQKLESRIQRKLIVRVFQVWFLCCLVCFSPRTIPTIERVLIVDFLTMMMMILEQVLLKDSPEED